MDPHLGQFPLLPPPLPVPFLLYSPPPHIGLTLLERALPHQNQKKTLLCGAALSVRGN